MSSNAMLVEFSLTERSGLPSLVQLSAELGADKLLVQGSGGNTSIKIDGTLWVKASGKWLSSASGKEMLVPVDLCIARECLRQAKALDSCAVQRNLIAANLEPSIETLMHAALPHKVVVHLHSVNAIVWAIRDGAPDCLRPLLSGLRWAWIPYVASGLPLAQAVALHADKDVLVLGNHGLVVCGEDCDEIRMLLLEVERRLSVLPRPSPAPKRRVLESFSLRTGWRMANSPKIHSLATDPISCRIARNGIVYPCQAIFLGTRFPYFPCSQPLSSLRLDTLAACPFLAVEGCGVLLNPNMTRAEHAILEGFAEVLARTSAGHPVRYLHAHEIAALMGKASTHYRSSADNCIEMGE